ncbi:MAG: hypothetical protein K9M11_00175 [Candidatus Pacebacteria bacterium]|nr:hypothetical protein [Candidatus Paceibacterota bacterium]
MKKTSSRLILWRPPKWPDKRKKLLNKVKAITLHEFLKRLLVNSEHCVFPESADLKNPSIKFGEEGINLSADSERLLICRVRYKYILKLALWFLPPYLVREYASLTVLAIASTKVASDEDGYARIQWLDGEFAESCAILYENTGRAFYLMQCNELSDRVRFSLHYIWNPITRKWNEEPIEHGKDGKKNSTSIWNKSSFTRRVKYLWDNIMN